MVSAFLSAPLSAAMSKAGDTRSSSSPPSSVPHFRFVTDDPRVREVGGGADLLSHFGLETCFSLLCQQPLPPSIAESGYLASALGDAHLRRGPGMELQPLLVQAEAEGQGGAAGGVGGGLGVGAALPGDAAGAEGAPGDGLALDKALLAQAFTFRTRHRVVLPEAEKGALATDADGPQERAGPKEEGQQAPTERDRRRQKEEAEAKGPPPEREKQRQAKDKQQSQTAPPQSQQQQPQSGKAPGGASLAASGARKASPSPGLSGAAPGAPKAGPGAIGNGKLGAKAGPVGPKEGPTLGQQKMGRVEGLSGTGSGQGKGGVTKVVKQTSSQGTAPSPLPSSGQQAKHGAHPVGLQQQHQQLLKHRQQQQQRPPQGGQAHDQTQALRQGQSPLQHTPQLSQKRSSEDSERTESDRKHKKKKERHGSKERLT